MKKTKKKLELKKVTIVNMNVILGGADTQYHGPVHPDHPAHPVHPVHPISWNPNKCRTIDRYCPEPSRDYPCFTKDTECI